MQSSVQAVSDITKEGLCSAVHRSKSLSRAGLLERLFTFALRGLVYPQIWEDPVIDMEALAIRPGDHIVAIASGGCNVLSYLAADPARITAVDLNGAHIALNRLKLCAAKHLPTYEDFFRFFGRADQSKNIAAYRRFLVPRLDPVTRAYWESRTLTGRQRIGHFSRNFYRFGLLGHFIGAGHWIARAYGCNLKRILSAQTMREQTTIFAAEFEPLFRKRLIRALARNPASLFGLGIPPAQYNALADDGPDGMIGVLRERLRKLACDFDIKTNYFAWQAFGRSYADGADPATPPYLRRANFAALRERCGRVETLHGSLTDYLEAQPAGSRDAYVLLDAQDWMNNAELTVLWTQITRTARPGARVIFRTAADERLLPGRVPSEILARWNYDEARCRDLARRDRSAIYGGFHLYTLVA